MMQMSRRILSLWLERLATDRVRRERQEQRHEAEGTAERRLAGAAARSCSRLWTKPLHHVGAQS